MSCLRAACLQHVSLHQRVCQGVCVCACVFLAIKNAALPAQDAATCHTSSLRSAFRFRLSTLGFVACCFLFYCLLLPKLLIRQRTSLATAPRPPTACSSLLSHFTFRWAIERQRQRQRQRQLLLVCVDFCVALINMQRNCKRTKRAKPKTNEIKKCSKNKGKK